MVWRVLVDGCVWDKKENGSEVVCGIETYPDL